MYQANMGLLSFVLMWGTKSEQDVVMNIVVKKYGTIERDYSHSAPIEFSNEKHSSLSEEKKLKKLEQYLNNVFCVMYYFIYRSK